MAVLHWPCQQGNCLCRVTMERKETLKRTERLGMREKQEGKTYYTPAAPEYPTYVQSVLKKEIFACGFFFSLSFPSCLPVRRSWNTVSRNSVVVVSPGLGAPANLTRKHAGKVDSALWAFPMRTALSRYIEGAKQVTLNSLFTSPYTLLWSLLTGLAQKSWPSGCWGQTSKLHCLDFY